MNLDKLVGILQGRVDKANAERGDTFAKLHLNRIIKHPTDERYAIVWTSDSPVVGTRIMTILNDDGDLLSNSSPVNSVYWSAWVTAYECEGINNG